jgi:hypothetical protein
MPTYALGAGGGGGNNPFGLAQPTNVGPLQFGFGGGASLDTLSASSGIAQCSTMSFTGVNYAIPASDSVITTVIWAQVRPTDVIFGGPILSPLASAVSRAAVWKSHCTIAGQFELGFINSSITAITLSVETWAFVRFGIF